MGLNMFDESETKETYRCPGRKGSGRCEVTIPRTSAAEIIARFGNGPAASTPPAYQWAVKQDNDRIADHFRGHTVDELIEIMEWLTKVFAQRVDESWVPMELEEAEGYIAEALRGAFPDLADGERLAGANRMVTGWWQFGLRLARNLKGPRL